MLSIKGTRTEKNVLTSFVGESQARNRYTYFSSQAKKEGLVQVSAIFAKTANEEKEHAKRFFSFLEGGDLEITGAFPAGTIGKTIQNLRLCIAGENYEHTVMYPEFAKIAKEENFERIASTFEAIAIAEKYHEKRYLSLLSNIKSDLVFRKKSKVNWQCRNCGYVANGNEAPTVCPACVHPQAYFEVMSENW